MCMSRLLRRCCCCCCNCSLCLVAQETSTGVFVVFKVKVSKKKPRQSANVVQLEKHFTDAISQIPASGSSLPATWLACPISSCRPSLPTQLCVVSIQTLDCPNGELMDQSICPAVNHSIRQTKNCCFHVQFMAHTP